MQWMSQGIRYGIIVNPEGRMNVSIKLLVMNKIYSEAFHLKQQIPTIGRC